MLSTILDAGPAADALKKDRQRKLKSIQFRSYMAVQVWDYASDGYVHRLVQSKTDGKLVEVPSPAQAAFGERHSTDCPEYAPEPVLLAACFINCISVVVHSYLPTLSASIVRLHRGR